MAKTLTLDITRPIIMAATRKRASLCMIAKAVHQAGGRYPKVTSDTVSFNMGETRYTYPLPARAAVELRKFDDEGKLAVKPFKVVLAGNLASTRPVAHPEAPDPDKVRKRRKSKAVRRTNERHNGKQVIKSA